MPIMIRREGSFSKRIPAQLAGLFLLLFAGLTVLVLSGAVERRDLRVSRAIERADHPWLTTLLGRATDAAIPLVLSLAIPIAWSLLRRRPRLALLIAASGLGSPLLNLALKLALHHNPPGGGLGRPLDWRSSPLAIARQISDSYSYPSGHVATAVVALGLWLLWLWPLLPRPARLALALSALAFTALLAYSRVYLGRHVATDILGGLLIGSAWLSGTIWLYEHCTRNPNDNEKGRLLRSRSG